ncbi:hypothetical protein D3C73_1030270 [compost metagenome]
MFFAVRSTRSVVECTLSPRKSRVLVIVRNSIMKTIMLNVLVRTTACGLPRMLGCT